MRASTEIRRTINVVEAGEFDGVLRSIEEENLGIWVPACAEGGMVVPMPLGYSQEEGDDRSVRVIKDLPEDSVRVAWVSKVNDQSAAARCVHCVGCCRNYDCLKRTDLGHRDNELSGAVELHPEAVESRVKALFDEGVLPLDQLEAAGLGVFMVHSHGGGVPFTTLPCGLVAVIEAGRTHFRPRAEVLEAGGFVPTTWRFEEGERRVVGGFAG